MILCRVCDIKPIPPQIGRKDDQGRRRWTLLPWNAVGEIVDVLMFGARKYGDHNWRIVPNAEQRYSDALIRHVVAYMNGERFDPDTGKSHLAHAGCCLLFLLSKEIETPFDPTIDHQSGAV